VPTVAAESDQRAAVVDLLGALAYGELTAFERMATDSRMAPTVSDKAALARMAAAEFAHFELIDRHLSDRLGIDPGAAMAPFVMVIDEFHDLTQPNDWLEGLIKAYVGDGLAADFYREVAEFLDEETRALVVSVQEDTGHAEFVVERVRAAVGHDPAQSGRLALWARRLVGEALTQAQKVAATRDALIDLLGGVAGTRGLAEVTRMFGRLTERHAERMTALGLSE
jgi:1,2-phenylacetyl-CoA epoxidase catalytic subunit